MSEAYLYRLWEQGQRHLAAGRYGAARRELEGAEAVAWRRRDAGSLARIYLPLLETRRLLRYQAAEGRIVIGDSRTWALRGSRMVRDFLGQPAGIILVPARGDVEKSRRVAEAVQRAAYHTGRPLEALVLLERGGEVRVASAADVRLGAGLPVTWTEDARVALGESTDANLRVPLPLPGVYEGMAAGLGGAVGEALIVAWETLALRWQGWHALARGAGPWEEMAWLREALRVDAACEPVTMRLIAVAEGLARLA